LRRRQSRWQQQPARIAAALGLQPGTDLPGQHGADLVADRSVQELSGERAVVPEMIQQGSQSRYVVTDDHISQHAEHATDAAGEQVVLTREMLVESRAADLSGS